MLDRVAALVTERAPRRVLELGVGTGTLTRRVLERLPDVEIVGLDFSPAMLEQTGELLPGVELVAHDLHVLPLPAEIHGCDAAAMSYVLHEFDDAYKLRLLTAILDSLELNGVCVVGDVCFPDSATREAARLRLVGHWDPEEQYLAAKEFAAAAGKCGLGVDAEQVGDHSGVLTVWRKIG